MQERGSQTSSGSCMEHSSNNSEDANRSSSNSKPRSQERTSSSQLNSTQKLLRSSASQSTTRIPAASKDCPKMKKNDVKNEDVLNNRLQRNPAELSSQLESHRDKTGALSSSSSDTQSSLTRKKLSKVYDASRIDKARVRGAKVIPKARMGKQSNRSKAISSSSSTTSSKSKSYGNASHSSGDTHVKNRSRQHVASINRKSSSRDSLSLRLRRRSKSISRRVSYTISKKTLPRDYRASHRRSKGRNSGTSHYKSSAVRSRHYGDRILKSRRIEFPIEYKRSSFNSARQLVKSSHRSLRSIHHSRSLSREARRSRVRLTNERSRHRNFRYSPRRDPVLRSLSTDRVVQKRKISPTRCSMSPEKVTTEDTLLKAQPVYMDKRPLICTEEVLDAEKSEVTNQNGAELECPVSLEEISDRKCNKKIRGEEGFTTKSEVYTEGFALKEVKENVKLDAVSLPLNVTMASERSNISCYNGKNDFNSKSFSQNTASGKSLVETEQLVERRRKDLLAEVDFQASDDVKGRSDIPGDQSNLEPYCSPNKSRNLYVSQIDLKSKRLMEVSSSSDAIHRNSNFNYADGTTNQYEMSTTLPVKRNEYDIGGASTRDVLVNNVSSVGDEFKTDYNETNLSGNFYLEGESGLKDDELKYGKTLERKEKLSGSVPNDYDTSRDRVSTQKALEKPLKMRRLQSNAKASIFIPEKPSEGLQARRGDYLEKNNYYSRAESAKTDMEVNNVSNKTLEVRYPRMYKNKSSYQDVYYSRHKLVTSNKVGNSWSNRRQHKYSPDSSFVVRKSPEKHYSGLENFDSHEQKDLQNITKSSKLAKFKNNKDFNILPRDRLGKNLQKYDAMRPPISQYGNKIQGVGNSRIFVKQERGSAKIMGVARQGARHWGNFKKNDKQDFTWKHDLYEELLKEPPKEKKKIYLWQTEQLQVLA